MSDDILFILKLENKKMRGKIFGNSKNRKNGYLDFTIGIILC